MKYLRKGLIISVVSILMLSFVSCGSSGAKLSNSVTDSFYADTEGSYYGEQGFYESYEPEEAAAAGDLTADNSKLTDTSRKLIKTYDIKLETENFEPFLASVENRILELNGYIQNMDTYNGSSYSGYSNSRYSKLTIRIPVNNLENFVNFVGETANVKNKNLSVEDVTLTYVDTKAKKETYEIEQERLLALLEKAETVEDMITIESRLSEVRYKLESQESILRTYDNLVDYSTVYLYIEEVKKYSEPEPVGYWERVGSSFKTGLVAVIEGLQDFLVWFVGALPSLVVFAIIIVAIVFIVKACKKAGNKKRSKKERIDAEAKMSQAKLAAQKKANENAE